MEEMLKYVIPEHPTREFSSDEKKALGKVYLASGWFTPTQELRRQFVLKALLDAGFEVFSPKDEALVDNTSTQDWREQVFSGNVLAISQAPFMLCITDEKDIGTIMEAGIAYAKNVPIVYFAETLGDNPFNLMLAQSGIVAITSREDLVKILNDPKLVSTVLCNLSMGYGTFVRYEDYKGSVE